MRLVGRIVQPLLVLMDHIEYCNVISSPTVMSPKEKSRMFRPLDDVSLGRRVPDPMRPDPMGQTDLMLEKVR